MIGSVHNCSLHLDVTIFCTFVIAFPIYSVFMLTIQLLGKFTECYMLSALIIHHKTPPIRVRPLKGSRAKYVPVLGSTPSIPYLSVEVPNGSVVQHFKAF